MQTLTLPQTPRALAIFREARETAFRHTDRLFAILMVAQWLAGIAAALFISPMTWIGTTSQVHWHVWAAVFLGGTITSLPVFLAWKLPGSTLTRHSVAVAQMVYSSLLIHLTGGRIETHFHIFGSLAFLAMYRDTRVLLTATGVVVLDHFVRGWWWPQSVFGTLAPGHWRWLEHAGWVLFEDTFLIASIRRSLRDMTEVANRSAHLETTNALIEQQIVERTAELTAAHRDLQDSEQRFSSSFEHAAIGMALVSPEGHWLKANRALVRLLGYAPVVLYSKTFQDITHPEDLEKDLGLLGQLLEGEIPSYQMEKRYFHKQGGVVWALLSVSLVRDMDGRPVHFISQIQDITEREEARSRLESVHRELIETSRRAGMAEVATSVLHNVGNVLNSVNISCAVVSERVRGSRIDSVAKTAHLLQSHAGDLAGFFATHPAARKLPGFLGKLADRLASEKTDVLRELQSLVKNIDHIKDIVAMQQNHAKVSGITEEVSVADLLDDSLRMNGSALERHSVRVDRQGDEGLRIILEKHKALQILVNLIRNACHACDESGRDDRRIILRASRDEDRVRISVIDNGVGIPAENLTRIFSHGFTTKSHGHGFALHSGALAALEMGGSLTAHSEGPGTGATFTLDLPAAPLVSAP